MNFSTEWIEVSEPYPHVFHVELNRAPANAFSNKFWHEFGLVFERLEKEAVDARVCVLSSRLPKFFTAGLDLGDFGGPPSGSLGPEGADPGRQALAVREFIFEFQRAIHATARCSFPVIAALHGYALGLGVDIMSACDIRLAASNSSFSIKEVDVGLAADIGSLAYVPKITGNQSLIRELAYTARPFTALEAEKAGLVSRVIEGGREEVIAAALDLAKTIAVKSPIAVSGTKHLISHARDHSVAENLEYTAIWNAGLTQTRDIPTVMNALKSKSKPAFLPIRTKL